MILSWGRAHRGEHEAHLPSYLDQVELAPLAAASPNRRILAHGLGRSYGDSPLNEGGALIITARLDRVLAVDWASGWIRAESGLTLDQLMRLAVPHGWFPPVTPGTKFVTLGGAVANDVHGKDHHIAGSFGAHVLAIGLRRSDGQDLRLARDENPELFALTIGGLGLTGFITWVEFRMTAIPSAEMVVERFRVPGIESFFELSEESAEWPYAVAWVDCFPPKRSLGRGIFMRARFAEGAVRAPHRERRIPWPCETPSILLNRVTIGAFNRLYYSLSRTGMQSGAHYDSYFFPLDAIMNWNKLYGARGFFQHQSMIPPETGRRGVTKLLEVIRESGQGSFLAVMKTHGHERSPGRLTFGGPGVSLALDFANKGAGTLALLERLDAIVRDHGGRLYPAKDGRMSGEFFRESYRAWEDLEAVRDPVFSSSFWRRVTGIS